MGAGGTRSAGFTILETLIVLTVTSLIAISTMLLVSGRQNKTEFQVAANNLKQQVEQLINETANGYYPSNTANDFTCNIVGSNIQITHDSTGDSYQGTNDKCVFLGKAISFGIKHDDTSDVDADETFTAYPLVAKRLKSGTDQVVASFADAGPIALAPGNTADTDGVDHAQQYKTQNGLHLVKAQYSVGDTATPAINGSSSPYAVFALADQLDDYTPSGGLLSSTTQKLNLYDYDLNTTNWGATRPGSSTAAVDNIDKGIDTDPTHTVNNLGLCFASGGTDQSALLTITGRGQLTVGIKIFGGMSCGGF